MKYLIALTLTILGHQAIAQFGNVPEKDSCYFRWITIQDKTEDGKDTTYRKRMTKNQIRYAEWECGKELGVADCNNDLTFDEGSNTVYLENKDFTNVASGNKPFTGTCESCYMNGRIQRKVVFVNGKENGSDTTYYETGCPQVIRTFVMGDAHGTWSFMYDSTEFLAWQENYYMKDKEGVQMYFAKPIKNENGRYFSDTLKIENYKAGILHGPKKTYYKRNREGVGGSIKREVNYKYGVMDGAFKVFNLKRVVIEELNYKSGKKDAECSYYYDDGVLLRTESWDMGVKNGEFKTFYYQGHIQSTENYSKGRKDGWFEEYYPDQSSKRRVLYSQDVLVEEYKYDEHGREVYSFPKFAGGGDEDDAMPDGSKKAESKEKFLKDHRKRTIKQAKKDTKAENKARKAKAKEERKKEKAEAKAKKKELKAKAKARKKFRKENMR